MHNNNLLGVGSFGVGSFVPLQFNISCPSFFLQIRFAVLECVRESGMQGSH